jgi:putative PIN family toxin of toxin-antitoxin system
MVVPHIIIDTNVLVSALRSRKGASFHLLELLGTGKFELSVSVPLVLEYESACKRLLGEIALDEGDIDNLIDYVCSVAHHQQISFLWRPFLKDVRDDMVLELAVSAGCDTIVTYNKKDFVGIEDFGIRALTAKEFLQEIGELK